MSCRTDTFSGDLLPTDLPKQSEGLSPEDLANIQDEEDADVPMLTPEMVNAQFPLVEPLPPQESSASASKDAITPAGEQQQQQPTAAAEKPAATSTVTATAAEKTAAPAPPPIHKE